MILDDNFLVSMGFVLQVLNLSAGGSAICESVRVEISFCVHTIRSFELILYQHNFFKQ